MPTKQLTVTVPFLPPLEEFMPLLREIWESKWLTNEGPLHHQFESALASYLGVPFVSLCSSGESALIIALKALGVEGEVITTPLSFAGTTHAILWAGLEPVFADIEPGGVNLDPIAVERQITSRTVAILPVHCYGRPADVDGLNGVAQRAGLPVVYDAAHTFAARLRDRSLASYGDLSILSFHATKVFTTFEGGAIICHSAEMKRKVDLLRNFGIADEDTVELVGLNAKMSEFQAAMGLLQLRHIDEAVATRKHIAAAYADRLSGVRGIALQSDVRDFTSNHGYMPILISDEYSTSRDALYNALKDRGIMARRYFWPLISDLPMYRSLASAAGDRLKHAHRVADRVLCLPIYPDMTGSDVERVTDAIADGA